LKTFKEHLLNERQQFYERAGLLPEAINNLEAHFNSLYVLNQEADPFFGIYRV